MPLGIGRRVRGLVASAFPGQFPWLYSTQDHNIEVPVQVAAYELVTRKYLNAGDAVLDVGFGLGYGLRIMAQKAGELRGVETDKKAVSHAQRLVSDIPEICELRYYESGTIPYDTGSFDVVTCVDVLEHVPNYLSLIEEMIRVSRRVAFLSTPNLRPEYTRRNGKPRNRWHIREWSYQEFDSILRRFPDLHVDWNFLNGPWDGPFECSSAIHKDTLALTPALVRVSSQR